MTACVLLPYLTRAARQRVCTSFEYVLKRVRRKADAHPAQVPVDRIVEKIVEVKVDRIVQKIVEVPTEKIVQVEKLVSPDKDTPLFEHPFFHIDFCRNSSRRSRCLLRRLFTRTRLWKSPWKGSSLARARDLQQPLL